MNTANILPRKKETAASEAIIRAVAHVWDMDAKILLGRSRRQPEAFARQLAMALCYRMTHMSLMDVGKVFGGRDHGTVIYACKVVDKASNDKEIKALINNVISKIKSPTPQG